MPTTIRTHVFVAVLATASLQLAAAADKSKFTLPPPNLASNPNAPKMIPQPAGVTLKAPEGFRVEEFASGFQKPRGLLQLPSGTILVAESVAKGGIFAVAGKGQPAKPLIEGLDRPFSMVLWKGYLYVSEAEAIKRFKLDAAALTVGPAEVIVPLTGYGKGHWTRSIAFDAKTGKMYVSVGSSSNVDAGDPANRAAINVYNADGSGHEIFATGLRNPVCIRFQPQSKKLWVTVQERDGLGDDLVPDFFTEVKQGAFYGWPFAYIGPNPEPRHKGVNDAAVQKAVEPSMLLAPHASVMDFVFYTGKQFPSKYKNGAFLAYRGSSGRTKRLGYSIMFVPFKGGKPAAAEPEAFVTGWMLGEDKKEVWGRPVGITQLADGSLLVSEDGNNKLWRVEYKP